MRLSERIRPGSEAAPWVVDQVKRLEGELAEAIEQRDKANDAMFAYEEAAQRTAYAERKLAKREKALEQLKYVYNTDMDGRDATYTMQTIDRLTDRVLPHAENLPELAEWLKQRGEKCVKLANQ